ncbi:unnamed protein product [Caenorhabditis auriculariae]|uniref:Serpentine receptor class gamma n=1 Tax=Caenorhabditis auriculariae TaxID=2777116 RepID=A0A8S1HKT4_9PELO|nr:unnamed protein product [Caenorhabditis auriculariae]
MSHLEWLNASRTRRSFGMKIDKVMSFDASLRESFQGVFDISNWLAYVFLWVSRQVDVFGQFVYDNQDNHLVKFLGNHAGFFVVGRALGVAMISVQRYYTFFATRAPWQLAAFHYLVPLVISLPILADRSYRFDSPGRLAVIKTSFNNTNNLHTHRELRICLQIAPLIIVFVAVYLYFTMEFIMTQLGEGDFLLYILRPYYQLLSATFSFVHPWTLFLFNTDIRQKFFRKASSTLMVGIEKLLEPFEYN